MRKPEPWFHKQSGNWKVQFHSKQLNLGKDKSAAYEKYFKLMAERGLEGRKSSDPTVHDVLNDYLAWCEAHRSKSTFDRMLRHLKRFAKYTGKRMKVADLSQAHMNDWIKQDYASSSTTYQSDAIGAVVVAINRAGVGNPISGMEKPPRQQRDFYLEPNQWKTLVEAIPDTEFRDYCIFALHTGARPQESKAVEARHYDRVNSRVVFPKSEAKGKKRPRYIYLDDEAREIIERRKKKEGPILINQRGRPWTKDSVNCRFRRLKSKLNMPKLCAYTLRHSFAVWKLTAGVEVSLVAKLMGHVDSRMVEQRYGHIEQNTTLMLRAVSQTGNPLLPVPDSVA